VTPISLIRLQAAAPSLGQTEHRHSTVYGSTSTSHDDSFIHKAPFTHSGGPSLFVNAKLTALLQVVTQS